MVREESPTLNVSEPEKRVVTCGETRCECWASTEQDVGLGLFSLGHYCHVFLFFFSHVSIFIIFMQIDTREKNITEILYCVFMSVHPYPVSEGHCAVIMACHGDTAIFIWAAQSKNVPSNMLTMRTLRSSRARANIIIRAFAFRSYT